jgi:hypothetical protein
MSAAHFSSIFSFTGVCHIHAANLAFHLKKVVPLMPCLRHTCPSTPGLLLAKDRNDLFFVSLDLLIVRLLSDGLYQQRGDSGLSTRGNSNLRLGPTGVDLPLKLLSFLSWEVLPLKSLALCQTFCLEPYLLPFRVRCLRCFSHFFLHVAPRGATSMRIACSPRNLTKKLPALASGLFKGCTISRRE